MLLKNTYFPLYVSISFIWFISQDHFLSVSDFEIKEQMAILEAGGEIANETRSFDQETR